MYMWLCACVRLRKELFPLSAAAVSRINIIHL